MIMAVNNEPDFKALLANMYAREQSHKAALQILEEAYNSSVNSFAKYKKPDAKSFSDLSPELQTEIGKEFNYYLENTALMPTDALRDALLKLREKNSAYLKAERSFNASREAVEKYLGIHQIKIINPEGDLRLTRWDGKNFDEVVIPKTHLTSEELQKYRNNAALNGSAIWEKLPKVSKKAETATGQSAAEKNAQGAIRAAEGSTLRKNPGFSLVTGHHHSSFPVRQLGRNSDGTWVIDLITHHEVSAVAQAAKKPNPFLELVGGVKKLEELVDKKVDLNTVIPNHAKQKLEAAGVKIRELSGNRIILEESADLEKALHALGWSGDGVKNTLSQLAEEEKRARNAAKIADGAGKATVESKAERVATETSADAPKHDLHAAMEEAHDAAEGRAKAAEQAALGVPQAVENSGRSAEESARNVIRSESSQVAKAGEAAESWIERVFREHPGKSWGAVAAGAAAVGLGYWATREKKHENKEGQQSPPVAQR